MRTRILIRILQFPAAIAIVLGIALLYRKVLPVNATTVALTFLMAILAVSTVWGMAVAVTMSVAAMVAFNYFFLPPVGTFTVADPENWVALFAFLAVAVISSHLATRARQKAADAFARGIGFAAVRLGDGTNNKKPQASSLHFEAVAARDAVKALKNPLQFFGRDAHAAIGHAQQN